MPARTTLAEVLLDEQRLAPELGATLLGLAHAARAVTGRLGLDLPPEALDGGHPCARPDLEDVADVVEESLLRALRRSGGVACVLRGDRAEPQVVPTAGPVGRYLVAFDPLGGATGADGAVATTFSVLRAPHPGGGADPADWLRPGARQVAAGYTLVGARETELLLTVGAGVHRFALDAASGEFVRRATLRRLPAADPAPRPAGPSLVADAHRVLRHGGALQAAGARLLDQANPLAFLLEQAGGRAHTTSGRVLDVVPTVLDERVAFTAGHLDAVRAPRPAPAPRIPAPRPMADIPLFGTRGLFAQPS